MIAKRNSIQYIDFLPPGVPESYENLCKSWPPVSFTLKSLESEVVTNFATGVDAICNVLNSDPKSSEIWTHSFKEKRYPDKTRRDGIVMIQPRAYPNPYPATIFEFKRPETSLSWDENEDQIISYGVKEMCLNSSLKQINLILCNGFTYLFGSITRNNFCDFNVMLYERTPLKLTDFDQSRNQLMFNESALTQFIALVFGQRPAPLKPKIDFEGNVNPINLSKMIGRGAYSYVYECSHILFGDLVIKFVTSFDEFKRILNAHELLKTTNITLPILHHSNPDSGSLFILYPRAKRVYNSIGNGEVDVGKLSWDHISQLYDKLLALHDLGLVHRDIRMSNVVIYNDEAFFIDLGFIVSSGSQVEFEGSVSTGSECYLMAYRRFSKYTYSQIDDLESFFKFVTLWIEGRDPEEPSLLYLKKVASTSKSSLLYWSRLGKLAIFRLIERDCTINGVVNILMLRDKLRYLFTNQGSRYSETNEKNS